MVNAVRETEKLLGCVDYTLNTKRQYNRRFSRSLYVSEPIKKGERFSEKNIKSVRPSNGLHPKYLGDVLGKYAKCDLAFATPMKMEYVDEEI